MLVSKVGPLSIRNNPKGPHLHKKPSNIIVTNPLRKPINRGRVEERGIGDFWARNERIRVRKTKKRRGKEGACSGR